MERRRGIVVLLVLLVACVFMMGACTSLISSSESGLERWALLNTGTRYEMDVTLYCLKGPDDCLMLIPESETMKEQFLVPIQPDQSQALIENREAFGIGYWPSSDHSIASELVVVAGSGGMIRQGTGPATGWNVHVTVRTENLRTLALVAAADIAVIAAGGAAVFLVATVATKAVNSPAMKKQSSEGGV